MNEEPRLYAIAKKITLDAGFPYTDPRTLETTQPRKNKMKNNRKPAWVLFEQLHVDVLINTRTSNSDRTLLRKNLNSRGMKGSIEGIVLLACPTTATGKRQIRVKITK